MIDIKKNMLKFSEDDIKNLRLVKDGDKGLYSRVYRLNEKECIKVFYYPKEASEIEKYNEFTKYSLPTVVFPKKLITINDSFYGYIMDYIDGTVFEGINEMEFSIFLKKYNDFLNNISTDVSEAGFFIKDLHGKNIMYDYKCDKFKAIDCDHWIKTPEKKEIIIKENYNEIVDPFIYVVKLHRWPKVDINSDFIEFYQEIRVQLENKSKQKVNTVGDMKRLLLLNRLGIFDKK